MNFINPVKCELQLFYENRLQIQRCIM
jgi:hypothetical protein